MSNPIDYFSDLVAQKDPSNMNKKEWLAHVFESKKATARHFQTLYGIAVKDIYKDHLYGKMPAFLNHIPKDQLEAAAIKSTMNDMFNNQVVAWNSMKLVGRPRYEGEAGEAKELEVKEEEPEQVREERGIRGYKRAQVEKLLREMRSPAGREEPHGKKKEELKKLLAGFKKPSPDRPGLPLYEPREPPVDPSQPRHTMTREETANLQKLYDLMYKLDRHIDLGNPVGIKQYVELSRLRDRIGMTAFEIATGIDVRGASAEQAGYLSTLAESAGGAFESRLFHNQERNYLGGFRGSWKALVKNAPPVDVLDAIAMEHDLEFAYASVVPPADRARIIREADEKFIKSTSRVLDTYHPTNERDRQLLEDTRTAQTWIQRKLDADRGGFSFTDWTTQGLSRLSPERLAQAHNDVERHILEYEHIYLPQHRAQSTEYNDWLRRGEAGKAETEAGAEAGADTAGERERERAEDPVIYVTPPPDIPTVKNTAGVYSGMSGAPGGRPDEVKDLTDDQKAELGRLRKHVGVDEIISQLQKLNEQGKKAPPNMSSTSLNPITGERNMRPLLEKGDVPDIVALTPKEKKTNREFYANWKWVQSGYGNGNQQPLPDQVGIPFDNNILAAYEYNQQYRYIQNYDGGAKKCIAQNKPFNRIVTPNTIKIYNVPMHPENQNFQAPTRNGSLPAGLGRPIHMARETTNGFNIFTPTQQRNSWSSRLFNGDVVDGIRV